jgi:hypothetical protein
MATVRQVPRRQLLYRQTIVATRGIDSVVFAKFALCYDTRGWHIS